MITFWLLNRSIDQSVCLCQITMLQVVILPELTGKCPNLTVYYEQKMTFLREIRPNLSENCRFSLLSRTPKCSKTFGLCPVKLKKEIMLELCKADSNYAGLGITMPV